MSDAVHPYYFSQKKVIFDRFFSLFGLLIAIPVFLSIGLVIFVTVGRPIFYLQSRVGVHGKKFKMLKFRTMGLGAHKEQVNLAKLNQAPGPMFKIFDDPRFVGIGKWLSKSGLDELPQLFNVLRGEMSIVGPRPLPVAEVRQLGKGWFFRQKVKPGIFSEWTLAESRHRSLADWRSLDQKTISKGGWGYDLNIIFKTLAKCLRFIF